MDRVRGGQCTDAGGSGQWQLEPRERWAGRGPRAASGRPAGAAGFRAGAGAACASGRAAGASPCPARLGSALIGRWLRQWGRSARANGALRRPRVPPAGPSRRHRHDRAQLRAAAHPLLGLLGPGGRRGALVRAQGPQPRGRHHHAGHHGRLLLPLLAHRHPGPGQPPVWAAAEERDHLVRAVPVGVTRHREEPSLPPAP